ncbi:MAG: GGDEF domain-containing protein [Candidatus Weimeria sp.]
MMENEVSKSFRVRIFLFIAIAVTGICIFVSLISSFIKKDNYSFNKGWSVSCNNSVYKNINMFRFRMPERVKKGESVELDNHIPDTIGGSMILSFRAEYSYVEVYVNGECIYSYMGDGDENQVVPDDAVHMVSLPEDAAGKLCRIVLYPGYDDAFSKMPQFILIPARMISASYMTSDIYTNLIGIFLFMIGLILLIVSIVLFFSGKKWGICFSLGLMALLIGTWSLCHGGVIELYSLDFSTNSRIQQLCLFFAVLPFFGLTVSLRGIGQGLRKKICLVAGIAVYIAFYIFALISESRNSVNIVHLFTVFQMVMVVCSFLVIYATKCEEKEERAGYRIMNAGIIVVIAGIAADIIRYHAERIMTVDSRVLSYSLIPVTSICYIIITGYSYLSLLNDYFIEEAKADALKRLAYTDVLTNLHNRAWSNNKLDELSKKGLAYQVISFDVNDLKIVNDSMGHAAGDALLRDCADILRACFDDVGHIIRTGGDEFLVIITEGRKSFITRGLKKMDKLEAEYSAKRKYNIKISYGTAFSNEQEGLTPDMVLKLADDRMYQMKKDNRYSNS